MIYEISEKMIGFIAKFEGFRRLPYHCSGGFLTIGYGHLVKSGEFFQEISQNQALSLLKQDILAIIRQTKLYLTNHLLSKNQLISITSFVFNLGIGNFSRSDLLKLINSQKITEAAEEFKKWNKVKGVTLSGLSKRREAESLLFLGKLEKNYY